MFNTEQYAGNLIESLMRITDQIKLDVARQTLATATKKANQSPEKAK